MYEKVTLNNKAKLKIKEIFDHFNDHHKNPRKVTYAMIFDVLLTDETIERVYENIEDLIEEMRIEKEEKIERAKKRKQGYSAFH